MVAVDPLLHAVAVAALVVLWGHAAAVKLRDRERLESVVAGYRLMPESLVPTVALVLPAIEFAVAAGLVASATRGVAASVSTVLLAVYAAAVAVNLARERRAIDCGCGGRPRPIHPWLVGRNAALAAVSAALLAPVAPRELGPIDAVNAAMMLAAAIGLYATLEQWLHNRQALSGAAGSREG